MHASWPAAIFLLTVMPAVAGAQCDDSRAIWAAEKDGLRHIVYGTQGLDYWSTIYFEEWRQQKLAWRGRGRVSCSNGRVICYVNVEDMAKADGTDAVIEKIDADGDGVSDWVVFAGLEQNIHYGGGARVEWFNGFRPGEDERVQMPSIYRLLTCRESGEIQ